MERLFIHSFQTKLEFGELFFVGAGYEVFSIYFFFKVYMFRFILFQPQRGEVTFHLPLHRHLAAFISLVSRLGRFLIIPPILSLAVVHKGQFIIYGDDQVGKSEITFFPNAYDSIVSKF